MSVRRRKDNGKYMIQLPGGVMPDGRKYKLIRITSPFPTKKETLAYEAEIRHQILTSQWEKESKDSVTVAEFAKDFLNVYVRNNNKNSVMITKTAVLENHLLPFFGEMKLDEVTAHHVERYKAMKLGQKSKRKGVPYGKKSINNQLGVLRKLLNVAVDWEYLHHAPRIKAFDKIPKPDFDFLDFYELERLLDAAEGQYAVLFETAAKTGLRRGELIGLRWEDVDLIAQRIRVCQSIVHKEIGTPKNGKPRIIPLSNGLVATLKYHKHLRGEYVFCEEGGLYLDHNTMARRLEFFCKKAGLRKIGYHVLRHTFASHLAMNATPLKGIQELLGHSTMDMSLRYAHLSPDVKQDYVNSLDEKKHEKAQPSLIEVVHGEGLGA